MGHSVYYCQYHNEVTNSPMIGHVVVYGQYLGQWGHPQQCQGILQHKHQHKGTVKVETHAATTGNDDSGIGVFVADTSEEQTNVDDNVDENPNDGLLVVDPIVLCEDVWSVPCFG